MRSRSLTRGGATPITTISGKYSLTFVPKRACDIRPNARPSERHVGSQEAKQRMSTAVCPRCGVTDFGTDEQEVVDTGLWAEEFFRLCKHVHERRHLRDLRTHTCPHWAKAMQVESEGQRQ